MSKALDEIKEQRSDDKNKYFLLRYDEFGKELVDKCNSFFKNTLIKISMLTENREINCVDISKRLAFITTIHNDPMLRSYGMMPITPMQSEVLLRNKIYPENPLSYGEDLALILYDLNGANNMEACALYNSLRDELNLTKSDLESRLLVVNAGLKKDSDSKYGFVPVALPGLTKVYPCEMLNLNFRSGRFSYGADNGLPFISNLNQGRRRIYTPYQIKDIGLRVLFRWSFNLLTWGTDFTNPDQRGCVAFCSDSGMK